MSELTSDQKRFMKYVDIDLESGCWLWTGSKAATGYTNFFYKGRIQLAHRASLVIFGKVKELHANLVVSHSCRNRHCVAPDHLEEKTRSENNGADKIRDGVDNRGERCHFSKLTWDDITEIRKKKQQGTAMKDLAESFAVSISCISAIVRGKTWKASIDETAICPALNATG
jgi:HNH endonuclease